MCVLSMSLCSCKHLCVPLSLASTWDADIPFVLYIIFIRRYTERERDRENKNMSYSLLHFMSLNTAFASWCAKAPISSWQSGPLSVTHAISKDVHVTFVFSVSIQELLLCMAATMIKIVWMFVSHAVSHASAHSSITFVCVLSLSISLSLYLSLCICRLHSLYMLFVILSLSSSFHVLSHRLSALPQRPHTVSFLHARHDFSRPIGFAHPIVWSLCGASPATACVSARELLC